tara:strand:+ start:466 stop:723 length:258 start_codon:yes stop_codon:yes gene_type:complete
MPKIVNRSNDKKRNDFTELLEMRVKRALKSLHLLYELSNKDKYSWSMDDITSARTAIIRQIDAVFAHYENESRYSKEFSVNKEGE